MAQEDRYPDVDPKTSSKAGTTTTTTAPSTSTQQQTTAPRTTTQNQTQTTAPKTSTTSQTQTTAPKTTTSEQTQIIAPKTTTTTQEAFSTETLLRTLFDPVAQAELTNLIAVLASGGTPQQQAEVAKKAQTQQLIEGLLGQYSSSQAFSDAESLIALQLQQALEKNMPAIQKSIEGAGTSASAAQGLLSQNMSRDAALAAGALGAEQAKAYGGITASLSSSLAGLAGTAMDPATAALLEALGLAKGAVENITNTKSSSGTSSIFDPGSTMTTKGSNYDPGSTMTTAGSTYDPGSTMTITGSSYDPGSSVFSSLFTPGSSTTAMFAPPDYSSYGVGTPSALDTLMATLNSSSVGSDFGTSQIGPTNQERVNIAGYKKAPGVYDDSGSSFDIMQGLQDMGQGGNQAAIDIYRAAGML